MKDIIVRRLQQLHPKSLIRDIHVEHKGNHTMDVNYLEVKKDDTSIRHRITIDYH